MADLRQARSTDGWLIFAAVIMFIVGFHNLIYGIAALRDYVVVVDNLSSTSGSGVIYADTTFWGWLWIAVGIVEMGIAFGIAAGNELARWVGIVIAALNAIGQLAFLAAFPAWSVIIIAIDVLVIYALATSFNRVRAPGFGAEPYPGDRPGEHRGAPARARAGAYAGGAAAGGAGGRYGGEYQEGAGGGDFFGPAGQSGQAQSGQAPGYPASGQGQGGTSGLEGRPGAGERYPSGPPEYGGQGQGAQPRPDSGTGQWGGEQPPPAGR